MDSKQQNEIKKVEVIEPFEDLTGVGAPYKKESRKQYLERREKEETETRSAFYREGLKGGLLYSGVTTAGVVAGCFASPTFKKSITWNIRTFIISSAFVAGYWVWGEQEAVRVMKKRMFDEMDTYYNHPKTEEEKKN